MRNNTRIAHKKIIIKEAKSMSFNMKSTKCPECGAPIKIEKKRSSVFCSYCGNYIDLENTNEHTYVNKTIDKTIDKAAIKRAEGKRDVQIRKIDLEAKRYKYVFIGIIIAIICITSVIILRQIKKPKSIPGGNGYIVSSSKINFIETILGQAEQKKELIVYSQDLTSSYTITQEGFLSLSMFKKSQRVDFAGKATYSIDLSRLKKEYISVDDDKRTITLNISSSELKSEVTYQPELTKFYDVEKGSILAFGDIKMTPEERTQLDNTCLQNLKSLVDNDPEILEKAESCAEQSLVEIFQPIIDGVISSSETDIPKYTVIVNVD